VLLMHAKGFSALLFLFAVSSAVNSDEKVEHTENKLLFNSSMK